jgi:threonine synthase
MEPTSAAAIAGARVLNLPAGTALIITGSGLKAIDRY